MQQMHSLGLSVSYNRVMELENSLALGVSQRYMTDGLVCPASLRREIYTVGALDNLDHNPRSNTSKGSFHGTGISIFQMPTTENYGAEREPIKLPDNTTGILQLPDQYTIVPAVQCDTSKLKVPERQATSTANRLRNLDEPKEHEENWLSHAQQILVKEAQIQEGELITWSSYHDDKERGSASTPGQGVLLPLFSEKAASVAAMVRHGMDIIKQITHYLNP